MMQRLTASPFVLCPLSCPNQPWHAWLVDDQVAGYMTSYVSADDYKSHGLTFLTVKVGALRTPNPDQHIVAGLLLVGVGL